MIKVFKDMPFDGSAFLFAPEALSSHSRSSCIGRPGCINLLRLLELKAKTQDMFLSNATLSPHWSYPVPYLFSQSFVVQMQSSFRNKSCCESYISNNREFVFDHLSSSVMAELT